MFKPYNYLQIVYHELGKGNKAADAAWTYLQKHPGDTEMQQNLDYYKWLYPEVERRLRKKELKNLELKLFNTNFRTG